MVKCVTKYGEEKVYNDNLVQDSEKKKKRYQQLQLIDEMNTLP